MNEEKIVSHTSEELRKMESRTDWERVRRMTDAEIKAAASADPTWQELGENWFAHAERVPADTPLGKAIDDEIIAYFKQKGADDYLTWINAVLRAYIEAHPLSDN